MNTRKRSADPFSDAVAVWHMADARNTQKSPTSGKANDANTGPCELIPHGKIELGMEPSGDDRSRSLQRGGDGKVARFDGGYLSIAADDEHVLDIYGYESSYCVRLKSNSRDYCGPILGKYGGDKHVSYHLAYVDGGRKPMYAQGKNGRNWRTPFFDLFSDRSGSKQIKGTTSCIEFVWGANPDQYIVDRLENEGVGAPLIDEARNGVMKINYPVALIGQDDWHDVIIRFTGPKLQLFIDGVLVDEEFPIGEMRSNATPFLIGAGIDDDGITCGFHGLIDHVAVWDRALTDEEISFLSGGEHEAARRELKILGIESDRLQYWRPRGHNTRAGDCMPFYHDGVFHLYYLVVRRNHHSKWQAGHGGLEIWHASTRDLTHWQHHPKAIPVTEQWEMWWGTGSFVFHEGTYYTLQKVPHMWGSETRGVRLATSNDGVSFEKDDTYPILDGEDVDIYRDDNMGVYHLLTGKNLNPGEPPTIVRFESKDLVNWEITRNPFIITDEKHTVMTCPHLFEWNGWYYFFGGFTERSGVWKSGNQLGPWELHTPEKLDLLAVPKTASFGDNRRIYAGFLEDHGWGGNLVFRELVQHNDGTLGTKFPPEMIPPCGKPLKVKLKSSTADVTIHGSVVDIAETDELTTASIEEIGSNVRITLVVHSAEPLQPDAVYGLRLCYREIEERGLELRFEPERERIQFAEIQSGDLGPETRIAIENVYGLSKRFELEIIIKDDIVDVCIANRRTIVTRYWNPDGKSVGFFAKYAAVTFDSIEIRPLLIDYA